MTGAPTVITGAAMGRARKGDWFFTSSGIRFWPLDPSPQEVSISDIAHGLSNTCRYSGQCRDFYSVAEHSVRVSELCERFYGPRAGLYGLLHDASEAYVCDIPSPLKVQACMQGYREVESDIMRAVHVAFKLDPDAAPDCVKMFDRALLPLERYALFPTFARTQVTEGEYHPDVFAALQRISFANPMPPKVARGIFTEAYLSLRARMA